MKELTKEEYALLSQFSYIDLPHLMVTALLTRSKENPTLSHTLILLKSDYIDDITEEQLIVVEKMLESPNLNQLLFVQYENKDKLLGNDPEDVILREGDEYTGFAAMGFVTPEGNPLSVYRGSEPLHGVFNEDQSDDWVDNLYNMLLGRESTQYGQAKDFFLKMEEEGDGRPILVGHSKAGNLAAYISSEFGNTDAYLFNPMPLHNNLVNEENLQSSNIHTHVAKNDFIATLLSLIEPLEIEKLLVDLTQEEFVSLLSLEKESIAQLLTNHPDTFSGIISRLSAEALTENEAELILGSLSEEEMTKLLNGDKKVLIGLLFEHRKELSDAANRLLKEGKLKDMLAFLADFNGNFSRFQNESNTYTYPGYVQVQNNLSRFWNMIDSHGTHNFYQNYYSTIQLNFSDTQNLFQILNNINTKLSNIDSELNVLRRRIMLDTNPLNLVKNLKNSEQILFADIKIGRSRTVANASRWLQKVETDFLTQERKLAQQAAKLRS